MEPAVLNFLLFVVGIWLVAEGFTRLTPRK